MQRCTGDKKDAMYGRLRSAHLVFSSLLISFTVVQASPAPAARVKAMGGTVQVGTGAAAYFVAMNGDDNGSGSLEHPWATINHAASQARAGDTIIIRGGHYRLTAQVRPLHSGRPDAWITFIGYPGEEPVLDAGMIQHSSLFQKGLDNGAFQLEDVSYVRVINLAVANSHDAGFTVRDSSHIALINDSTESTFSSGIAVWHTDNVDLATRHVEIVGNTIVKANTWDMAPPDFPRQDEPPHEAISVGGAVDFEVIYNHVYDSDKEGIDIKGASKAGKVHHNVVNGINRQGIYIDAWFGVLRNVEVYSNAIYNCQGAGLVLSVEEGRSAEDINIHDNLIFNNEGSGLLFSRFSADGPRRRIKIAHNVFYHNGYGPPKPGQSYYWITGGIYFMSSNVGNIAIYKNVFSSNRGFQLGYSESLLNQFQSWRDFVRARKIEISNNVIYGRNTINSPIEGGGAAFPYRGKIYAVNGQRPVFANPMFKNPAHQDFGTRGGFAAYGVRAGLWPPNPTLVWRQNHQGCLPKGVEKLLAAMKATRGASCGTPRKIGR